MKMDNWLHAENNVVEMYKKKNYDEIREYVEDNLQHLTYLIDINNQQALEQASRTGSISLNRFMHYIESEEQLMSVFYMGMLKQCIDVIGRKQYKRLEEEDIESYYKERIKPVTNMDKLVLLLGESGELNHSQIKEKLDISKSTLSEFMIKAEDANIVWSKKQGRYKFSRLTDTGQKIYYLIRREEREEEKKKKEKEYAELKKRINFQPEKNFVYDLTCKFNSNLSEDEDNIEIHGTNIEMQYVNLRTTFFEDDYNKRKDRDILYCAKAREI